MYVAIPCTGCSKRAGMGSWYDDIVSTVGQVGQEAVDRIRSELLAKYGAQAWDALPEAAKQSAISAAWQDVQGRVGWVKPALYVAGAFLAWRLFF